jgi:hypothetical protein
VTETCRSRVVIDNAVWAVGEALQVDRNFRHHRYSETGEVVVQVQDVE